MGRLNPHRAHLTSALVMTVCLLASSIAPASATKGKILVLLDSLEMQETHSKFLQNINPKAFDVTIGTVDTKSIKLKEWDSWLFDKLVILGGATELGPGVKPTMITEFFNAGHDLVLAISESSTSELRDLSIALGVDVAPLGNVVIDHFNFNSRLGGSDHTAITSNSLAELPAVFSAGTKGPVAFKGVPLSIAMESEVAFHAVTGSETAYSGVAGEALSFSKAPLAGKSVGLLTLVQGRNNARIAVSGSTDMLSNKFFSAAAGNAKVAADVLRWTFRQKSVLRASPLRHRNVQTNEVSPALYRINDVVEVAVDIEECTDDVCKPFKGTDVQIEFVMLDPHVRTTLVSSGNGTFSAVVKVPDVYGVFKWVLDYRRLGYSWIVEEVTVPVRPFRHYEYERFIVQAYPYYASVASMMAGFFALGFAFLYSKDSGSK